MCFYFSSICIKVFLIVINVVRYHTLKGFNANVEYYYVSRDTVHEFENLSIILIG